MTTCGYFWMVVIIVLAMIGVTVSAVNAEKSGKPKENGLPHQRAALVRNDSAVAPVEPAAIAYRRGRARYVTCRASTRLDDGYIVSMGGRRGDDPEKMLRYAKKELAAILAEQALAAGGIEFSKVGGELRAVMRTVTGDYPESKTGTEPSVSGSVPERKKEGAAAKLSPRLAEAARSEFLLTKGGEEL